ncbi:MAG: 4'-phosphopantetheinyl transferase family protein [Neisseriaceae bacterium]
MSNIFIIAIKINLDFKFEQYMYLFDNKTQEHILKFQFRKDRAIAFCSALLKYYYLRNYLNCDKAEILEDHYHRPFLSGLSDTVDFNISHSGEYVVMIIGKNVKVGIDIELFDTKMDVLNLAPTVFSKSECKLIVDNSKFFILWTKKEAMLKCIGHGFLEDTYLNTSLNCEAYQQYQGYQLYTQKSEKCYLSVCVKDKNPD